MNLIPNLPNPTPEEAKLEAKRAKAKRTPLEKADAKRAQQREAYQKYRATNPTNYTSTPPGTKTKDELRIAHNGRNREKRRVASEARTLAEGGPRRRGANKICATHIRVPKPERPALVAVMRIVAAAKPEPVARPVPACRRAKPKPPKVPKVFKSTVGQILCRVSYPSKYKGLVDRCEIWVNAADVEAKRAKYLALGGTFHTAHVIIIQPVEPNAL